MTSPFDVEAQEPPVTEEVENPIERLPQGERDEHREYLRSSVKAQRDAEVLGHRNYSR